MRYREIMREAKVDNHANIYAAVDAYNHLYRWLADQFGTSMLKQPIIPDDMYEPAWAKGGYAILATKTGLEAPNLVFCFIRERTGKPPMFGVTHAGEPVLLLPLLKAKLDLRGIAGQFHDRAMRAAFIHEFVHYLQRQQTGEVPPSSDGTDATPEYYNDPYEIDAFFSEAVGSALVWARDALSTSRSLIQPWFALSDTALAAALRTEFFDRDFLRHLTPVNRRRMDARLRRFIRIVLRPLLHGGDQPKVADS